MSQFPQFPEPPRADAASQISTLAHSTRKVLLIRPPFFTPWTPPLGIALLKAHLEEQGHSARCVDFNADTGLWGIHHEYFAALRTRFATMAGDGYTSLWAILNAHLLAYANTSSDRACEVVLASVLPLYGFEPSYAMMQTLTAIVRRFYKRLHSMLEGIDFEGVTHVGVSSYTTSLAASVFVLREVKRYAPAARTIIGGGVFADDLALGSDNLAVLDREYPFIDHIVLGEGESLLAGIVDGSLAHKRILGAADAAPLNIDEVPIPDFSDLNVGNYYQLTIEGGRSCPFQCSFCSETVQWGKYRRKRAERMVTQMSNLAERHGMREFFMADSLMNPYIMSFAAELLKRNTDLLYDGYLRADPLAIDSARTELWSRSGLFRVRLGIESASRAVLERMQKMTTPETISESLKALWRAGIRTTTYWIVGFPGETEEDFAETLRFIWEHRSYIYELEAHPYYYYPYGQIGSRLYKSRALYEPSVTSITKFQVWDVLDELPQRAEKFDRLARITRVASAAGLPNIYTMEDRYRAEYRWRSLSPAAKQMFAPPRGECESATDNKGSPIPNWPAFAGRSRREVVAYEFTVSEEVDVEKLAAAADNVSKNTEAMYLKVDGEAGRVSIEPNSSAKLLARIDEFSCIETGYAVERLAASMEPIPGCSMRIGVIKQEPEKFVVVTVLHRAITDLPSGMMIARAIQRAYVRLRRDIEPDALLLSCADAMERINAEVKASFPIEAAAPSAEWKARVEAGRVDLSSAWQPVFRGYLETAKLSAVDMVAWAVILAAEGTEWADVEVDVTFDLRRMLRDSVTPAVGPFTCIAPFPHPATWPDALARSHGRIRTALELRSERSRTKDAGDAIRVLVDGERWNLDTAVASPKWRFEQCRETGRRNRCYDVEIVLEGSGPALMARFCRAGHQADGRWVDAFSAAIQERVAEVVRLALSSASECSSAGDLATVRGIIHNALSAAETRADIAKEAEAAALVQAMAADDFVFD